MKDPGKTGYSLFVVSILILIVNDWYLKAAFHNGLTGKLSDFAGLFAFPFLLSRLLPKHKLKIHSGTILLFIFWKSQYAEIPIDIINRIGIPVQRVADPTDNIALLSVLLSYFLVNDRIKYGIKPIFQKSVILISGLAFMATTLPPGSNKKFVDIDQDYHFDFSKRELVSRLNMVQLQEIRKINKHNGQVDFNSKTNTFHYHGQTDTLALILDYQTLKDQDTIIFKTSYAEISITGDENRSTLKLLSVYKYVPQFKDKDYQRKATRQFEKRIIRKIKQY